ncbi:hypothetical protein DUI87_09911 [Hirundo rustica rustica]|uniref:Uncharacterized protein n=1 Tax=Hirundo rustica rustica TaxID=333673 RepID=A0A3M0KGX5_HIRRU|nr:hypothetical protein DUI87_09911 [Hirundo rustica rustica]
MKSYTLIIDITGTDCIFIFTRTDKDQQKRDRLIQTLEKYKKDLVHGLPASPVKRRSISPNQQKTDGALLENGHPLSGQSNYPRTKKEQPLSVSCQKFTSRTLTLAPAARKAIPNTALYALSQTPVHSPSAHRSSASPLLQPHMPLGSHNRKKAFQNSVHKTYTGDLLDKHAIYFTEKKQCFTPQILKTSHQAFLIKYKYYNPPSKKRSSSPGTSSIKSAGIKNKKREGLHRFLEDEHMRPHSAHFSQQPVENHELWSHDSEMPFTPGLQLEELMVMDVIVTTVSFQFPAKLELATHGVFPSKVHQSKILCLEFFLPAIKAK